MDRHLADSAPRLPAKSGWVKVAADARAERAQVIPFFAELSGEPVSMMQLRAVSPLRFRSLVTSQITHFKFFLGKTTQRK